MRLLVALDALYTAVLRRVLWLFVRDATGRELYEALDRALDGVQTYDPHAGARPYDPDAASNIALYQADRSLRVAFAAGFLVGLVLSLVVSVLSVLLA